MTFSREKVLVFFLLTVVLLVNTTVLWPETRVSRVDLNDNVFHYSLVERIVQAIQHGENPLDCWSPEWSFGFPVLRVYQPLAHWLVVAAWYLTGKYFSLLTVFVAIRFLSLALLPLSFFVAARGLGFPVLSAGAAAILSPLVSTNFLYGVEYGSFTWAGSGLFPQAVGTHLFLLSLAVGWRAVREGRRTLLAGVLVGLTLLAHLIYGYMAALSLALLLVVPNPAAPLLLRFRRLAAVAAAAFATSAFQIIPLLRDGYLINHSRWEAPWKWDSFGAASALQRLFTGQLLDFDRLPVLSVLALAGLALLLWDWWQRRASPSHCYLALGAALWILLFFGRSFWGPLLTILGISEDMHLHRVIGGAHVFLVFLAAVALARLWSELTARRMVLLAAGVTALLLYPAAAERYATLVKNGVWGRRNLESYSAEQRDVDAAIASAKQRGGRAYSGLAAGWGGQFKVGDVPFHAFLSTAQVPTLGFLYHALALTADTMVRFNDQWPVQYRLFNVRTLISPTAAIFAPPGTFVERAQFGRFRVYDAPGNGYFDIVDADTAVRVTRRNIYDVNDRWLSSDWPAKRAHLLLELRDPGPPGLSRIAPDAALPFLSSPAPDPGRVLRERQDGPQAFAAETETLRPAYALFKMTWHPNWSAYVDGAPQKVRMLSPGFSGVALPPGQHRVEFRYEPGPSKPLMALAGLLLLIFAARRGPAIGRAFDALLARFAAPDRRLLVAAGVVALTAPVVAPLFSRSVLWGHDAFAYFPRLIEVHRNLQLGILLPRWAPDFGSGAGQPLFIFHPPLFYWIGELWHLAGFDPVTAVNLAAVVIVLAAAVGMYFLGALWFGSTGAWLAAAAYLYAPYFAVDLYVRSAMEEFTAFPLVVFSLYGFGSYALTRSPRKWLLGAGAFGAVLFCCFPAALLFAPVLVGYLALTSWLARSWRIAAMQAAGFALALAFGAWSWIPAVAERKYVALGRGVEGYFSYTNHFVSFQQLIHSPWGYGYSLPGPLDGMSLSLGWSHLLLAVLAGVWAVRRLKPAPGALFRCSAVAAVALCVMMSAESLWIWEHLPLLAYAQFPWRLLQPAALCLALMVAALGPALDSLPRYRRIAIGTALALLIVPGLAHFHADRFADIDLALWTPARLASTGFETTTSAELSPVAAVRVPPRSPNAGKIVEGQAEILAGAETPFEWSGKLRATSAAVIEVERSYYPGWSVRVDGSDVEPFPAVMTGRLRFRVEPGNHEFQVSWGRTPTRRFCEWLSLAAILVAAAVLRSSAKHT
jgi:hypothetical protein